MTHKRCIIIGSGLGGLSCALMLARGGYEVTVLEQGQHIGGCLQCFTRRGVKFETGMHFIGSASPGQILDRILTALEVRERITLDRLNPEAYDIIRLGQTGEFHFANGRDAFVDTLGRQFSSSKDELVRYHSLITKLAGEWSIENMNHTSTNLAIDTRFHSMSVDAVLDATISNPLLRTILAGNQPLYAGVKGNTPFALHAFISDFYNKSAWRIAGGSDILSDAFAEKIQSYGGSVQVSAQVTRIVCDSTHATGVEINGCEFIPADYIIATQHPDSVMKITDSKLLRPALRRRIAGLPDTVGCFSVYLNFKPDSVPYLNSNYFSYSGTTTWNTEMYTPDSWPESYLYMHLCHKPGERFARSGIIIAYMNWSDVAAWADTKCGMRGAEYEAFKREHAGRLIASLERDRPEVNGRIERYYTSTPLTYRDYTGTRNGAMYGIAKDVNTGAAGRVQFRLKVPNLLLAGQNINSHGILGTLVGSIVTASTLLPDPLTLRS